MSSLLTFILLFYAFMALIFKISIDEGVRKTKLLKLHCLYAGFPIAVCIVLLSLFFAGVSVNSSIISSPLIGSLDDIPVTGSKIEKCYFGLILFHMLVTISAVLQPANTKLFSFVH